MVLREYLSIRRAYNLVRQDVESARRLSFAEFAILCRLSVEGQSLRTSDIAEYQGSLRPTMTHRTKHLAALGFLAREKGGVDRRNVICSITDEGRQYVEDLCAACREAIPNGQSLSRTSAARVCRYVDTMGSLTCMAGDLTLLGLYSAKGEPVSISRLVEILGLLQPTVSMSVAALVEEGLVRREEDEEGETGRTSPVVLTDEGWERADALNGQVERLVVHRRPRASK